MRIAAVVVVLVAGCGGGGGPDVEPDAGRSTACLTQDETLQAALDDTRTSANAMLAVRNEACGTSVYTSGPTENADLDSLYRIASVTKTFVAGSIMSMEEDGLLELDDPLSDHVADVDGSAGVTVRMLLDHQSGIYDYTSDPAFFADRSRVWTPRELVDFATAHGPTFAPGTSFGYSNTNYVLLGMILEAVGAEPAGDVLHARAIDPAGLEHTFFDGHEPLDGTLATGFDEQGNDVTFVNDPSAPWTAGAMVASGADLVDWIYTYLGTDTVLGDDARAQLTADPFQGYGLGIQFWVSNGATGMGQGHFGSIDGYNTVAMYFPFIDAAFAVVVNDHVVDPGLVLAAALDALHPAS